MKKYTQTEFDAIPRDEHGIKNCPTGDYTEIKSFPENCRFGVWCSFGEWCTFGGHCRFGGWCTFGKWCSFGKSCIFGKFCSFGERCSFGKRCRFGEWCSFGERCSFGECCSCEFGVFKNMLTIGGFGSEGRTTYFFLLEDNTVGVRCGCFSGTLDEWKDKVKKTHGDSGIANAYLMAADTVMAQFDVDEEV